ncbi:ATP synthase F1 subunit delta [Patescibacteria group bacterium]
MKVTAKQLTKVLVDLSENKQGDELEDVVESFMSYLKEEGRLHEARAIMQNLDQVWKEKFGAANVSITTAHKLTESMRQKITQAAQGATIKEQIDLELIGGAKIRIDDRIIDGSISGQLDQLKQTLRKS